MRNIGGGIGIAGVTTIFARHQQLHMNNLTAHVNPYDPEASRILESIRSGLMASGSDFFTATRQSYAALSGMLQRQAVMLSFIDVFQLLGMVFLLMIPLIFLMKKPAKGAGGMPVH
jgi:MFS transporter, DHA2 family, multidrug resistance protein